MGALTRLCQTIALATGFPVFRSQRIVVSRWFVIPIAARSYSLATASITYDELKIPPHRFTYNSNNDYTSASLGAGYALGKVTDLYLEANHYRADNFVDNSAFTSVDLGPAMVAAEKLNPRIEHQNLNPGIEIDTQQLLPRKMRKE